MENFIYQRPTELIFGKDTINLVGEKAKDFKGTVIFWYCTLFVFMVCFSYEEFKFTKFLNN